MSDDHRPDEAMVLVTPPFDAPDADIILCSSDGADIRTHKFILSFISPVFKTMLSLPQPSDETTTPSSPLPTITMEEDRNILEKLLRPCYPSFDMSFDSFDDVKGVVGAAVKYDMQSVLVRLKKWIFTSSLFQTDPLAFYVMSCVQGWEAEARLSAAETLEVVDFKRGANHYTPGLEDTSAGIYYRLVTYHARCSAAARATMQDLRWFNERLKDAFTRTRCSDKACPKVRLGACFWIGLDYVYDLPKWFHTYLHDVEEELFFRPCASTVTKSKSFNTALLTGASCNHCREHLVGKLHEIQDAFTARVARVISQIQLEFVPPAQKI
ncbi:hypothetical protein BJ138DRAFT_1155871 [Hygrophoropsis aurantiaca]|uniref:Uncharacterized protein n=1 Tax=Hygrophoropsis aurantiaca TaxID=72124 RepID=A0ACB8A934_9AGAM|nr:hypothetical protein BJ138DRAFT_1155871 [Hygrophoropsis aurantiaca]